MCLCPVDIQFNPISLAFQLNQTSADLQRARSDEIKYKDYVRLFEKLNKENVSRIQSLESQLETNETKSKTAVSRHATSLHLQQMHDQRIAKLKDEVDTYVRDIKLINQEKSDARTQQAVEKERMTQLQEQLATLTAQLQSRDLAQEALRNELKLTQTQLSSISSEYDRTYQPFDTKQADMTPNVEAPDVIVSAEESKQAAIDLLMIERK